MQSLKGYGNRLRKERLRLDLTQEQIANECDISRVQWGKYEREVAIISKKVLKKLQPLGVDVDFVLYNNDSENPLDNRGIRVEQERLRLGLTQKATADKCGVSRIQWGRYERNENRLDGEILKRFCELGADSSFILTGVSQMNKSDNIIQSLDELQLIRLYRTLNMTQKEILIEMLANF